MEKSEKINELALAMTKAQAEMGGAVTDSDNPFWKSKYADLGSIIRVIKPPFKKHGLAYSQFPITSEDRIGVETVIVHSSGQFMSNEFTMRVPKADPQSAGGVISYCRRYALQAVCGVPSVDSDGEEYMQVDREEEERKAREEEEKKKAREEERKAVKEEQSNLPKKSKYDPLPNSPKIGNLSGKLLEELNLDELKVVQQFCTTEYWKNAVTAEISIKTGDGIKQADLDWDQS